MTSTVKKLFLLFILLLVSFSYFLQGGGHNQNSYIAEIRQFVEAGSVEIDRYGGITGDVSPFNGHIYSNKTPSFFFFSVGPYWAFYNIAKLIGVDRETVGYKLTVVHFITIVSASIWGALLGVVLFFFLGHLYPSLKENDRFILALSFTLGSYVAVYATMAFAHTFQMFWSVCAFFGVCVVHKNPSLKNIVLMSLSYGLFVLSYPMAIVLSPLVGIFVYFRSKEISKFIYCVICVSAPVIPFLLYNYLVFGSPFTTNRHHLSDTYSDPNLFLGVFQPLDISRIEKLLYKGNRAIFWGVPYVIFAIPFMIHAVIKRQIPKQVIWYPMAVGGLLFTVAMSFNGWHGGSCWGPRNIMSFVILLCVLSVPLYQKFPRFFICCAVYAYFVMLIGVSTNPMPSEFLSNPLGEGFRQFLNARFNGGGYPSFVSPRTLNYKFNLGFALGLVKFPSLLLLIMVQGVMCWMIFKPRKRNALL